MLPISANSFDEVFELFLSKVRYPKAGKKIKVMKKVQAVEYFFTMPLIIAGAINKYLAANEDKDSIRILIDDVLNKDIVDQFAWLSVVPALVGKPDLKLHVVAINEIAPKSEITKGKKVIEQYIRHEMDNEQFNVELFQSSLDEAINELEDFDLVLNQLASSNYLLKISQASDGEELSPLERLMQKNIPYVLSDFTSVGLMYQFCVLRTQGFSTESSINHIPHTVSFNKASICDTPTGWLSALTTGSEVIL